MQLRPAFGPTWLFILVSSLCCGQAEVGLHIGVGQNEPWRSESEDRRGDVQVDPGLALSIAVSYADRIESGKTTWMRFDLQYSKYRIKVDEHDQSLCCSTRDSAIIDLHLATLRMGPEFEIGRLTKLFIPLDLSWPISSKASGYRNSFIPPNQTQRNYQNEKSNYGRFNLTIGAGVSFGFPISSTYVLSIGPVVSLGLFDQAATTSDVRLYNYSLMVSLRRRVSTPRFLPQD